MVLTQAWSFKVFYYLRSTPASIPCTLGAIMKIRLILVFQLLFTVCNGQTSYYKQNDSTVSELYKHFSICQTLKSSRPIDKKKVDIDRSVVRFCNDLYNGAFTKRDLETLIKKFTKTIHDQTLTSRKSDSLEEIAFTLYSNGNLQVSYSAVLIKDSIISFKIFIGTNTQVDCNASGNTVQYFDFVYLKSYFLKEIDFPLLLKPLTAEMILSNKMN